MEFAMGKSIDRKKLSVLIEEIDDEGRVVRNPYFEIVSSGARPSHSHRFGVDNGTTTLA